MAVVDLADYGNSLSRDFCVWFHPRERLTFLQKPKLSPERIKERLGIVSGCLKTAGLNTGEPEVRPTAHGPHGLLSCSHGGPPDEVVLNLGPWGWTRWDMRQWRESQALGDDRETDDFSTRPAVSDVSIILAITEYRYHPGYDAGIAFSPGPGVSWDVWGEAVAAAAAGSILVPFIKAFAARAGEDCYEKLRNLIRCNTRAKRTSLLDPETRTELVFDPPLPDDAIRKLARIKPARLKGRIAEWNKETGDWEISRKPPAEE